MEQEKMHDIALMRYSVIAPLITGLQEDYPSLPLRLSFVMPRHEELRRRTEAFGTLHRIL